MFVLRIVFRSGQSLDLNFFDLGVATNALEALTEKRINAEQVQILDDAGRAFRFDGADVLIEGLIDVQSETASIVKLGLVIDRAGTLAKQREGIFDEAPADTRGNARGVLLPDDPQDKRPPRFST